MSSPFSVSKFKKLKEDFDTVAKRVLKKQLSINPIKLKEYEDDLKAAFDEINNYANLHYFNLDVKNKRSVRDAIVLLREKLQRCWGQLGVNYNLQECSFKLLEPTREEESATEEEYEQIMTELTKVELLRLSAQTRA